MKSLKFLLIGFAAVFVLGGCNTVPKKTGLNTGLETEKKFYLSAVPVENSPAFANFLFSPKTERAKLNYLIDQIREARNVTFYYEGGQYGWTEACAAGTWLLQRHYKEGENARSFLKREVSYTPNRTASLMFASGPKYQVYQILLNELELLEEKLETPSASISQTA